jgi:hypothetical protein
MVLRVLLLIEIIAISHLCADSYNGDFSTDYIEANKRVFEDPGTGKMYIAQNSYYTSSFSKKIITGDSIVNFISYDPVNDIRHILLPDTVEQTIIAMLFETKYDSTNKKILLNGFISHKEYYKSSKYLFNNTDLKSRSLSTKIFILTEDPDSTAQNNPVRNVFLCDKNTFEVRKLTVLNEKDIWCIDLRNRFIRIIRQFGPDIKIENFKW